MSLLAAALYRSKIQSVLAYISGVILNILPKTSTQETFFTGSIEIYPGLELKDAQNWKPLKEFKNLPNRFDPNKDYYNSYSYDKSYLNIYTDIIVFGQGLWALKGRTIVDHVLFYSSERNYARRLNYNWLPGDFLSLFKVLTGLYSASSMQRIERAIILDGPFNHFGHWPFEHLTKLRQVENLAEMKDLHFLVKPDFPTWKLQFIRELGFDNNIIEVTTSLFVNELYVPSYPQLCKTDLEWLRLKVFSSKRFNEIKRDKPKGNLLYLSRGEFGKRVFTNEADVKSTLSELGWTTVYPEKLSIMEQACLTNASSGILGVGGSALFNAVWLEENSTVVYIGVGDLIPYLRIAKIFNHSLTVLWDSVTDSEQTPLRIGNFNAGTLNLTELRNALNSTFEASFAP